ncbi:MAG: hypothetical protein ACLPN5_03380 [Roseiarcus sp.]
MSSVTNRPAKPYPGLRPFEETEWSIFFGRERMIGEVIDRLARDRLVLIHGASGSGKSSLVRAGVLPKLARQYRRHGGGWLTSAMRPSGGPLWNLASEFARLEGRDRDVARIGEIVGLFNRRDATLATVAGELSGVKGQSLCVLVDQFEELFRFEKETSREEAEAFVALIGRAARADDEPAGGVEVHVVVTLRSEFLGQCARFDGLAETINRTQYLVPRMDDDALLRAVRMPAKLYGGEVEEPIARKLIAGVRGREDELPLLQHGLMLMWEEAAAMAPIRLDGATVERAGGLAALLSNHADAVMARAAPDARSAALVESLFRELTEVNAEGVAIRRPRTLRDLSAVAGASAEELRPILEAFRAPGVSFLTPYPPAEIRDATVIDISHEALIRAWRRISSEADGWLRKELDDGLTWRLLLVEARAFVGDRAHLLPEGTMRDRQKLLQARNEAWSSRYGGAWRDVGELLRVSHNAARASRRLRVFAAVALGALTISALLFAGVARIEWRRADAETAHARAEQLAAESERNRAEAQTLVAETETAKSKQTQDRLSGVVDRFTTFALAAESGHAGYQELVALVLAAAEASESGNPVAKRMAGQMYTGGFGFPQDYAKAREWFEKAVAAGDPDSLALLGELYADGKGVAQDYQKARELFEKGAAAGNGVAMDDVGFYLYESGHGAHRDYAKALEWYEKAAAAGNAVAMNNIGALYDNGRGVERDYDKARGWYAKAAAAGNIVAKANLGYLYDTGHGVPRDYVEAFEWYQQAAGAGNLIAMNNIGVLYDNGRGVRQDYARAREWYEKAAGAGNALAMNNIGNLYDKGRGVTQDYAKAREWYEKAAAAGNSLAMNNIGALYDNGHGVAQDYAKAREWYEKAAAAGNSLAIIKLGALYAAGHGVAEDFVEAKESYEKAAAAGDDGAWAGLSRAAIFTRDFPRALSAAERARQVSPDTLETEILRADALMLLGRTEEARALYLAHRDETLPELGYATWRQVVLDDFAELRKAGLTAPLMGEIEAKFAANGK